MIELRPQTKGVLSSTSLCCTRDLSRQSTHLLYKRAALFSPFRRPSYYNLLFQYNHNSAKIHGTQRKIQTMYLHKHSCNT